MIDVDAGVGCWLGGGFLRLNLGNVAAFGFAILVEPRRWLGAFTLTHAQSTHSSSKRLGGKKLRGEESRGQMRNIKFRNRLTGEQTHKW